MKFKTKIFTVLMAVIIVGFGIIGAGDYSRYAINDSAVTSSNDSLTSAWISLNGATNVAIFYTVDDSTYVKGGFEYRYGSGTEITNVAADTLSLDNRVGSTGLSKGKILQGYGLAASLIPGANAVRFKLYRQSTSGDATNSVQLGIIYGD